MKTIDSEGWGAVWAAIDSNHIVEDIAHHSVRARYQKIMAYLRAKLGSLEGKTTIEIGCGGAIYSLLFAQHGAKITLFDYSAEALKLAEKNLKALNLNGELVQGDAFKPPEGIKDYDLAMSFGTVEHYHYPERYLICKSHADFVKPNGIVLISTPNVAFLPHELLKLWMQKTNKWFLGYEGSFSRGEMLQMAHRLYLSDPAIVGSSFHNDFSYYTHVVKNTATFRRYITHAKQEVPYQRAKEAQRGHWWDDYFGLDIAVLDVKRHEV